MQIFSPNLWVVFLFIVSFASYFLIWKENQCSTGALIETNHPVFSKMMPRPAAPATSLNLEMQDLTSHPTCNASSEHESQKCVFYQSPPTDSDTD